MSRGFFNVISLTSITITIFEIVIYELILNPLDSILGKKIFFSKKVLYPFHLERFEQWSKFFDYVIIKKYKLL